MGINRGDQTVPTVLFPDGSTLTNPRLSAVIAQLVRNAREVAAEPTVNEVEGDRRAHR
jgi:hypothetical protein